MKRSEHIRRVRAMLQERRDSLVQSLRNVLNEEWSALPAEDVRDYGDAPTDTEFREMIAELANVDARELRQIDEAIVRADEGSYGVCSNCHRNIPIMRLKVLPYATRCVGCQRAFDAGDAFEAIGEMSENIEDVEISSDDKVDFRKRWRPETFGMTIYEPPSDTVDIPAFIDLDIDANPTLATGRSARFHATI